MKSMFERYTVLEMLSGNGPLFVYRIQDRSTGQVRIAKMLWKKYASQDHIHQFRIEIDVLSQLRDKYMPFLIDVIETKESLILLENMMEGEQIDIWKGKHPIRWILYKKRFAMEILDRLEVIHQIGYLYVDLKPKNLLVHNDHINLIDFNACIPQGSHIAYMASHKNHAPELFEQEEKGPEIDVYAYGALMDLYFHKSILRPWVNKCMAKRKRRFKNLKRVRQAYRAVQFAKIGILIITLSVFFLQISFFDDEYQLYQRNPTVQNLILAYEKSIQQGSSFYEWIVEERIHPSSFEDLESASFLIDLAIRSNNRKVIEYVLNQIPSSVQDEFPLGVKVSNLLLSKVNLELLDDILSNLEAQSQGLTKAVYAKSVEEFVWKNEIVLEKHQRQIVAELMNGYEESLVQENYSFFIDYAILHCEYVLFLKSKGMEGIPIPEVFVKVFSSEHTFIELYNLERRST